MATTTTATRLKYSHTIGRSEFRGPGVRSPVALAINSQGVIYTVSRSYEYRPDGRRVTMFNIDEEYLGEFGEGGERDGQFVWPSSIAIDRDLNVYVSDEWLNRISIFTKTGDFIGKWGVAGSGDGKFNRPSGLAFDNDDNLIVVDGYNNRVQKFTKEGRFISKFGAAGSGDGEFNLPWGIALDSDGNILIADWRNDRIQKFSAGGKFLKKFGSTGSKDGQFNRPTGVAVDRDGDIYVADCDNNRMQAFDRHGKHLATYTGEAGVSKWGKIKLDGNVAMYPQREVAYRPEREKDFYAPVAVAVDPDGRVLVAESIRQRVQVYTKV